MFKGIDCLNEQAAALERASPSKMLDMAEQAKQLAIAASYTDGLARSLAQIGKAHVRLGNLAEAERFLTQAQEVASGSEDSLLQVDIYNSQGVFYLYSGIYDKAFTSYLAGLSLARGIGAKRYEVRFLNNIGEIYRENKDFATAIDYYNQTLAAQNELDDYNRKSIPLANLSSVYIALGDLSKAQMYAEKALNIARAQGDQMIESVSLQYLGIIARMNACPEEAIRYLQQSLEIYKQTREMIHATEVLLDFHKVYFQIGNIEQSLYYLEEALATAEETDSLALRIEIYSELAEVYEYIDDLPQALFYFKKYQKTVEAIDQAERQQRLRAFNTQIAADISFKEKETYRQLNEELDRKAQELKEAIMTGQAISDIGKSITATLSLQRVLDIVYQRLQTLMPTDSFGISLYNEEKNLLEYVYLVEDGKPTEGFSISLDSTMSLAVACFKQRQGILLNFSDDDVFGYVDGLQFRGSPSRGAGMFQPLIMEDECLGVITVQSYQEQVYNDKTLDVLEVLSPYLSIAIQNARKSEMLQNEVEQREKVQQELERLNRELARLSNVDGLTNVANRRYFDNALWQAWQDAVVEQNNISLIMVDVDFLKEYNDKYGHLAGDDAIKKVAQALELVIRPHNYIVARYGGDEFAVLMPNTGGPEAALVGDAIKKQVEACYASGLALAFDSPLSVSIGVASMAPQRDDKMTELIARSDRALYDAKEAGGNRIYISKQ